MALKNKTVLWIFIILITGVCIFHLLSLAIYPIAWFDETLFASISKDFLERGKLFPFVAPIGFNFQQCYTYGPVYFAVEAAFIKVLGFGSFAARLVAFVFNFSMGYYFIKIFLLNKRDAGWFAWILLLCFFFDYTMFESSHLGRMETMAMTFIYGYTFFILKNGTTQSQRQYYINAVLFGLFAALAVLTTPRSAVLLIPPALILLFRFLKEKREVSFTSGSNILLKIRILNLLFRWIQEKKKERFIELLIFAGVFVALFLPWFFYAFGSVPNMINFYKIVSKTADFAKSFSFKDSIYIYQYPAIFADVIVAVITLIICGKAFFDEINIISILSVVLFYALIAMNRPYATYTVPYFYLFLLNCFYKISRANPGRIWLILSGLSVYCLLLLMMGLMTAKAYYIYDSRKERNPQGIDAFIKQNVPPGSKVVGDEMYYYAVLKAGSDFQYMSWYGADTVREKYQREDYKYDYIIEADCEYSFQPKFFNLYKKKANLELVGRFNPPLNKITNYVNVHRPSLVSFFTYNGYLYRRIKNQ